MELVLNLAWVLMAAFMVCLWHRVSPRTGASRRMQLVALAVLLLILFPVISVTDDLRALQNPAETDCCQRRHVCAAAHSVFTPVAALPSPALADLAFGERRGPALGGLQVQAFDQPALAPIQSRPPPAA